MEATFHKKQTNDGGHPIFYLEEFQMVTLFKKCVNQRIVSTKKTTLNNLRKSL